VVYVRLIDGGQARDEDPPDVQRKTYEVQQVGIFAPDMRRWTTRGGEVGFLTASIKRVADAKMGETSRRAAPTPRPCPGYRDAKPWSSRDSTPSRTPTTRGARRAGEAPLNDSAFSFEPETSLALGYGFRCGFLGMLTWRSSRSGSSASSTSR